MNAETMMGTELRGLRRRRPEVAGTVIAGTDGLLITSDLPATDATHLAALAAASFGLGHRMAATVRQGAFHESVVHTAAGCVVTYPAGRDALLTLVADPGADLAALREEARGVVHRTGPALAACRRPTLTPHHQPDPHAPLAVRTPMSTLPNQRPRRDPSITWRRPPI
ncbi:roadblock/LC7 domain-containing protein [Micromonospora sp. WMMD1082]|uniref:roadblock/LC7 domain-containing protein n=1 Tax=Micromonospora sp. WMMD1082 TaxID=3016104 RepID=UPI002417BF38|nr:roadblock/LC7 domain-containing protein [Micromonospora sp. WMMD1082]MDG4796254.1 roadblock/LC7 domain-containing protein [Micromonospora sp. WMMD1082]